MKVLYLYQVLRGFPPEQVFAQTVLGFELASVDPRMVGLNFVMPEDGYLSMRDYHLHMSMLDYLHSIYPKVRMTLHAGELSPGMVAPEGLKFHIREAVDRGHAERIGHGVDVMYEDRPYELLQELAAKHIVVEINLTSNDVILWASRAKIIRCRFIVRRMCPWRFRPMTKEFRASTSRTNMKRRSRSRALATWSLRTWLALRWNTPSSRAKVCGPHPTTSRGAKRRAPGRLRRKVSLLLRARRCSRQAIVLPSSGNSNAVLPLSNLRAIRSRGWVNQALPLLHTIRQSA